MIFITGDAFGGAESHDKQYRKLRARTTGFGIRKLECRYRNYAFTAKPHTRGFVF